MNAGIYDTEHFETTYTLIRLLDYGKNKITIFIAADLFPILKKMLRNEGIEHEWHLLQRNKLINSYIVYRYCKRNKIDTLFLNTVSQHHILFGFLALFLKKIKTVLTVHDANSFFNPQFKIGLQSIFKYFGKKLLLKNVTHFVTLLSSTKLYVEKTFKPEQSVFCIPGSFFEGNSYELQSTDYFFKLVVPGAVDLKRRNYSFIVQLLSNLKAQAKIEIVLLGGMAGNDQTIVKQCKSFESELVRIKIYDQFFIEVEEYERQLSTCDFILAPIQRFFEGESSIPEEYGVTKSSGSFFDAVRFGKPMIISAELTIPEEIEKQCIRYHSVNELAAFIETLNLEKKLLYSQMSLSNSSHFTLENIRKKVAPVL